MSHSTVLKNGTVITFDEVSQSVKVLPKASILVIGDTIQAIEEDLSHLAVPPGAEILDLSGRIVSPGFVNTHLHAWQTAYRTVAPDVTLPHYFDWLSQDSRLAQTGFTPDDIYISSLEGYLEGLNGGVTSYVDHAHNNWGPQIMASGFDAAIDSGARIWWCYEPISVDGFPLEQAWDKYQEIAQRHRGEEVRLGLSLSPTVMGDQLEHTKKKIRDLGIEVVTMHHLGGPWSGQMSSPTELARQDLQAVKIPVILSHAPYLSEEDQATLRRHDFHVSITPESEFHYGHGQTTGHLVMDQASLGIDTNFTFSGDILTQARLWLQRTRDIGFSKLLSETGLIPKTTPMTAEQGFLVATRQGGRSLWRDDIGILKPGAKADIVVFTSDSPNMLGWSDPVAAVMLHANVGDIEHVLVGGEFRKRDFKLVNMKYDWSEVKNRFMATAKRIHAKALPSPPVADKLWGFKPTGVPETFSTIPKV